MKKRKLIPNIENALCNSFSSFLSSEITRPGRGKTQRSCQKPFTQSLGHPQLSVVLCLDTLVVDFSFGHEVHVHVPLRIPLSSRNVPPSRVLAAACSFMALSISATACAFCKARQAALLSMDRFQHPHTILHLRGRNIRKFEMSPADARVYQRPHSKACSSNELNLSMPYSLKLIPAPMVSPPYSLKWMRSSGSQ